MKIITLILCAFIFTACPSQEATIYRSFDPSLTTTQREINMQNAPALFPTQFPHFFYVAISTIVPDRKEKGFAIVEVDDQLLTLYHENLFPTKAAVEKILEKKDTLAYFPATYLVQNIDLSAAQQLPSVTSITDEKLATLRKLDALRKEKLRKIPEHLAFERKLPLFAKQLLWLNARLLLLGYQPSQNPAQQQFIVEKLQLSL